MNAQHTPGPWTFSHSFDADMRRDIWTATDSTGRRELVAHIPNADGDHINADARLIAAAPDLLAALIDVLDADGDLDAMDFNQYRAAIAKATGGAA